MAKLEPPTNQLVAKKIGKFRKKEQNVVGDQTIARIFKRCPKNVVLADIHAKVIVVNSVMGTRMYDTFSMAKNIKKQKIDEGLRRGNPDVVGKIASGHGVRHKNSDKDTTFYSFATKYCFWHNPKEYPIFDKYVAKLLMAYQKQDPFTAKFKRVELRDFKRFKSIILDFRSYYKLTHYSLREIDNFLWHYGKELEASK